jgi:diguanylate cyclase (GGDEF)-like protein
MEQGERAMTGATIDWRAVYDHAPASLWIEDFSALHRRLQQLRAAGVEDFDAYVDAHPYLINECMAKIEVVDVNATTLRLYKARDRDELLANLHRIFRDDMERSFREELRKLWDGVIELEVESVNYALDGTPIFIQLRRAALPGHEHDWSRILISIVDISERKRTHDRLVASERYAQGLFQHSPVSLWVEDYAELKAFLDGLRAQGISNIRRHLHERPELVEHCMRLIKVIDVNQQTLALFEAPSREHLVANLHRVFRDEMRAHFEIELADLWEGKITAEYEGINYALSGTPLDILLRRTALPGAEHDWSRVLVAISDITARKRAEAYLSYLGTHDALTGLKNRAYFEDERKRMEAEGRYPVSMIVLDLNGLKALNDREGHHAGDALVRRAGEVLQKACGEHDVAARIGGDEFAMLLPYQDERVAQQMLRKLAQLVELNNQFYQGARLSFAIGAATGYKGMPLMQVQREADRRMYDDKKAHYRDDRPHD